MQTYQSTPDYYRDYIEHGWLKDQAAKAHKYIERWKGKNGKWYYRYKSKAQEKLADAKRYLLIGSNGKYRSQVVTDGRNISIGTDGKPKSYTSRQYAMRYRSTDQPRKALEAGRKRAAKQIVRAKQGAKAKGYSGNLSSRGYSGSKNGSTGKAVEGSRAGRVRAAEKGYIKGQRPGSRQKRYVVVTNEDGTYSVASTSFKNTGESVTDRKAYIKNRNMVAAYRARKNRRAK